MGSAFKSIKQGLREAITHASGQPGIARVHTPEPLNVQAIRKHIGMTQTEFAAAFGISVNTLRHWERGDRIPRGPARVLLRVVAKAPRVVLDALATPEPSEGTQDSRTPHFRSSRGAARGRPRALVSPNQGLVAPREARSDGRGEVTNHEWLGRRNHGCHTALLYR
jgi:putative transcriptional regulator